VTVTTISAGTTFKSFIVVPLVSLRLIDGKRRQPYKFSTVKRGANDRTSRVGIVSLYLYGGQRRPSPDESGGLNRSMQHLRNVFLKEARNLILFVGDNSYKTKALFRF
jgi:hypothetical protein